MPSTAVLDATIRVSSRVHVCSLRKLGGTRSMQLAMIPDPAQISMHYPIPDPEAQAFPPGRKKRKVPLALAMIPRKIGSSIGSELARRVQALETVASSSTLAFDEPSLSEDALMGIYEDLLALPEQPKQEELPQIEGGLARDLETLRDVERRILGPQTAEVETQSTPLSTQLRMRRGTAKNTASTATQPTVQTTEVVSEQHSRILDRVQEVIERLETVRTKLSASYSAWLQESAGTAKGSVPVTVLSNNEWAALTRVCVENQDEKSAERTLELMHRAGVDLAEETVNTVLAMYANAGSITKTEAFMAKFLSAPTESQRDLHVKAHILATPQGYLPTSALSTLHAYETKNTPAPMDTYGQVIRSLFSVRSLTPHAPPNAIAHSQAWDLFAHMRYVAHPEPSAKLYGQMIRACATSLTSRGSEPERALDLWTEMTVDHAIPPTLAAYNAVILACSRSGEKHYVNEGLRLAKQMMDGHRDAHGASAFAPDARTFKALLEGAKRVHDLGRTRWILAQMVRGHETNPEESQAAMVDEEVMMHVFHAYASYIPPFHREDAPLVDAQGAQPQEEAGTPTEKDVSKRSKEDLDNGAFARLPPQTHAQVISEATVLFERILEDTGVRPVESEDGSQGPISTAFSKVQCSPRLLSAYLAVFYKHGRVKEAKKLFNTVFEELKVERTARIYVEALAYCDRLQSQVVRTVTSRRLDHGPINCGGNGRIIEKGKDGSYRTVAPRLVERATFTMVRILIAHKDYNRSLGIIRDFYQRYPPTYIKDVVPNKPAMRATRTVLVGERPLVRMSSTVNIPDESVPPLFTFADIELLHHRLVAARRLDDVGFLRYACTAYEHALRGRRNDTMKAPPAKVAKSAAVDLEALQEQFAPWVRRLESR